MRAPATIYIRCYTGWIGWFVVRSVSETRLHCIQSGGAPARQLKRVARVPYLSEQSPKIVAFCSRRLSLLVSRALLRRLRSIDRARSQLSREILLAVTLFAFLKARVNNNSN